MIPDWIQRLVAVARQVAPKEFWGSVQINLQGGGVTNVNVNTSYKEDTAK